MLTRPRLGQEELDVEEMGGRAVKRVSAYFLVPALWLVPRPSRVIAGTIVVGVPLVPLGALAPLAPLVVGP
eukprot:12648159-Alexandrium_andersonii.AAC.1